MNIANPLPSTVASVSFSFLSTQDVRRISVKQITNPVLLDDTNRPNVGGLYDPALGPSDARDLCATCKLTYFTCPGHFGHIELPAPVFHPLFILNMYNLLRGTCLFCHKFKVDRSTLCKFMAQFRLLECGFLDAALGVDEMYQNFRRTRLKRKRKERGDSLSGDEDEGPDETFEGFEARINRYVDIHLSRAPHGKKFDYKDGLVYQMRKEIINNFLKSCILKTCLNEECGAPAYTFRKEGHTKIVEYDLSAKQKKLSVCQRRPNVLLYQKEDHRLSHSNEEDQTDDLSETESLGESVGTGEETGEEYDVDPAPNRDEQLPRTVSGKLKTKRGRNERLMTPEEARAHLRRLFRNEATICSLLFGSHGPSASCGAKSHPSADIFFLDVLFVPPTRFRPPARIGETLFEHPQNELLAKALHTSYRLRDLQVDLRNASGRKANVDVAVLKGLQGKLLEALIQLQVNVNSFMDSSKNPAPVRQGKLPPPGVKQGLEKKEGLFRKHMMGKRVNYAARSVISPDVNIEPNEIGIPPIFAKKLTYPEPVTPANFHELRRLVITGPRGYPGATVVEYEDGNQLSLDNLNVEQRTAIANQLLTPQEGQRGTVTTRRGLYTRTSTVNKKVYRHLLDGDILIVNRQPTLHRPSMMAHKARILHGERTIRLHYANCNSYNADFDGDEMNLHFPQNQIARTEAMFIANTDNQYLVPTSGKPLRGLIQDHIVAGVWMTSQDSFFTREEYFQLLYGSLRPEDDSHHSGRLLTLPPTIWKPKPLWTGKQIISTILKNITPSNAEGLNLKAKSKVPGYLWGGDSKEDQVIFMDGELLCGVTDNSALGATGFSLVHSIFELYGPEATDRLLGILSRLFTKFLQHRAFTCSIEDLALTADGEAKRSELLQRGKNLGTEASVENFPSLAKTPEKDIPKTLTSLLEDVLRDEKKMTSLDVTVKNKLSNLTKSIADACIPNNLLRNFPYNNMQTMTLSGAKGSGVNAQQISCALGQQELEGRRVPVMVSGKTLPSFKAFETRAVAGGYVASRFLTGIKPQEFYFHCMAGREGLIDTAVKTSRSGYLQRCLIKHLEGLHVHYDYTVRGSDSSVYQFYYGGDALDVTRSTHLHQFEFIARNRISLINRYRPKSIHGIINDQVAVEYMKKVLKRSAERPDKHTPARREKYLPALAIYNPSQYLGSTSECFAEAVENYIKTNPDKLLESKKGEELAFKRRHPPAPARQFRMLLNFKYMRSLVDPGEAVGLLASQGVGEPSTQMTLNTFHFAGHGAANVTLGIPRLREIIMTASQKPKTPSMTIIVGAGVDERHVNDFCKKASRLTLAQVVREVKVTERRTVAGESRRMTFNVVISFYPEEECREEYAVEPWEIMSCFGELFPQLLRREVTLELKKISANVKSVTAELGKGRKVAPPGDRAGEGEGEDGDDAEGPSQSKSDDEKSELGDDDAEDTKRARKRKQQATYESDGEEEAQNEDVASDVEGDGELEGDAMATAPSHDLHEVDSQVREVGAMFENYFPFGEDFSFSPAECSFRIEFSGDVAKVLLVGIIERVCRKTIIREILGIAECFSSKEKTKGADGKAGREVMKITTNGSNFFGMWKFANANEMAVIDFDELYSNDIHAILKAYGVEMARTAIVNEIKAVFKAYNISVDTRHLELIADYMTFEGGYKPFNRKGISTNPSPLLKASFETTTAFLTDAALYGDFDDLRSPSGRIVLGQPSLTGTGIFDVVMGV